MDKFIGIRILDVPSGTKKSHLTEAFEIPVSRAKIFPRAGRNHGCVHFRSPDDAKRALALGHITIGNRKLKLSTCCRRSSVVASSECPPVEEKIEIVASSECPATGYFSLSSTSSQKKQDQDDVAPSTTCRTPTVKGIYRSGGTSVEATNGTLSTESLPENDVDSTNTSASSNDNKTIANIISINISPVYEDGTEEEKSTPENSNANNNKNTQGDSSDSGGKGNNSGKRMGKINISGCFRIGKEEDGVLRKEALQQCVYSNGVDEDEGDTSDSETCSESSCDSIPCI